MKNEMQNRKDLAIELSKEIGTTSNAKYTMFCGHQQLLGFSLQFLKPDLLNKYCTKYGMNVDDTEIVLMQAEGMTECHMHQKGLSLFRTLGPAEKFLAPNGSGILTADYKSGQELFDLKQQPLKMGDFSVIEPNVIHAFYATEGSILTALGIVSPRIRKGHNDFDVVDFDFIDDSRAKVAAHDAHKLTHN